MLQEENINIACFIVENVVYVLDEEQRFLLLFFFFSLDVLVFMPAGLLPIIVRQRNLLTWSMFSFIQQNHSISGGNIFFLCGRVLSS